MSAVRVRFAPSPTGRLHVGNTRTALFNWLLARSKGGAFVLRIEDTDLKRSTTESELSIFEDLRQLGLDWDEGPDCGGPHGPYRQSERLDLYRKALEQLRADGAAYPCFCSEERLKAMREDQKRRHLPPRYDGTCLRIDPAQATLRLDQGEPAAWRFRVPEGRDVAFPDLIRGDVHFPADTLGDFVLVRSNGIPAYNFAVVVDDAAMEISHVVRGEDHLSNTPKQLLLFDALHSSPPVYAHLPLVRGLDAAVLSKREGSLSLAGLLEEGYLPQALINYLALLGWSSERGEEFFDVPGLIREFSLDRVAKSPAAFDPARLQSLNGRHIRLLSIEELVKFLLPRFEVGFPREWVPASGLEKLVRDCTILFHDSAQVLEDFVREARTAFDPDLPPDEEARAVLQEEGTNAVLTIIREKLVAVEPWENGGILSAIKEVGKASGRKGKALYFPLRAACTGRLHGPELLPLFLVLGKEVILRRLDGSAW